MAQIKWIWQDGRFPDLPIDEREINSSIETTSRSMGVLEGAVRFLDLDSLHEMEIDTATNELLANSEIEGEILNRDSVRSSVIKRFSQLQTTDKSNPHTEAVADILFDSSFNHAPLDHERLHGWHNALFPTGYSALVKLKDVARYRSEDMEVVGGDGYSQKIYYEAPPPDTLHAHMDSLFQYINRSKESVYIKAAKVHLWFVAIHPYDDGNGRISRYLVNNILSKELGIDHKYFSFSSAVLKNKKSYYDILEKSTNLMYNRDYDFTSWAKWHTETIDSAIKQSINIIDTVAQKAKFWDIARQYPLNQDQIKFLNKILDVGVGEFKGDITNKKYRKITGVTQLTASRHLKYLVDTGLLNKLDASGRSTKYEVNIPNAKVRN